ncbi:hypothetical protein AS361_03825 [Myroides marinus]|uniref:hypothetical protein n=1 Tax=Myroides marinus TaxID=703342 RepID=UPI0007422042|nr:hypothetical protein [Myroides marinus]KUF38986.1 hypothetical protein AS361_03825 [Myroides marinus]
MTKTTYHSKECFKCKKVKILDLFYKHPKTKDGHLNKCKECCKSEAIKHSRIKSKDPTWVEKQRERSREKYIRLNYKTKQFDLNRNRNYKDAKYKNLSRKLKPPKGHEIHHWSYLDDNFENVFILDRQTHRRIHYYLIYDSTKKCFKSKCGQLLDSQQKHIDFLITKGYDLTKNHVSFFMTINHGKTNQKEKGS